MKDNNKEEYFGFIYIWYDKKRKKFCIGSHKGSDYDGYVTSTGHMMRAYKKRPEDFKRRILEYVFPKDKDYLRSREEYWLNKIKPEELGVKYYNFKRRAAGGNLYEGMNPEQREVLLIKLRNRPKARQRAVMINGVRFETVSGAQKALGFNPYRRLNKNTLEWIDWFYEDAPKDFEICERNTKNWNEFLKIHSEHMRSKRSPDMYLTSARKSAKTRKERNNYPCPNSIAIIAEGVRYKSYSEAGRVLKKDTKTIMYRVKSNNFPEYLHDQRQNISR